MVSEVLVAPVRYCSQYRSRRRSAPVQFGCVFDRLDDLHVASAAADVAAERGGDFASLGDGFAAQEAGRRHDEPLRAVAALRTELVMKAALDRGEAPIRGKRLHRIDPGALDACRPA